VTAIIIDGRSIEADSGRTIIAVARENGIYIPSICHHPDLPPFENLPLADRVFRGGTAYDNEPLDPDDLAGLEGCGLCMVEAKGQDQPVKACRTLVTGGMSIRTDSEQLRHLRQQNLIPIMARHPHACVTCAQREGCSLEDCSSNTAKEDRCCPKFHNCELRKVAEFVGVEESTPRFQHQGLPALVDEPLYYRDFNLCIDCARCVRVCNQVRGVEALGIVHQQGRLIVGSIAPTLSESECRFCGACVEVCPTGCLMDKNGKTADREQWLVPCVGTCPAGADVPGYIRAVAKGDFVGAAALIRNTLPLPNTLGYICFHDCEMECRRGQIDDPIAICALKRFAIDRGDAAILERAPIPSDNGKNVAVVGAGPAGLSAAYFLRFKGYGVTLFDAADVVGGVPATAIPRYRLPREVLARDVDFIRNAGVSIETGREFTSGEEMAALVEDGYDALVVAVGLPSSKKISVPGVELAGVFWGLEFLQKVKDTLFDDLGANVIVVGGGNVAIDVAMTAMRLTDGRSSVRLYCLEDRKEMPAHEFEIDKAEAEGVEVHPSWGPVEIRGNEGRVESIGFHRCISAFDDQGRFAPSYDEETRTVAKASTVILAIGQAHSDAVPEPGGEVFLAGDATGRGPFSVVDAVASGRRAASDIDALLGGDGDVSLDFAGDVTHQAWIGRIEGFATRRRAAIPTEEPLERRSDFREIEGSYSEATARFEASRCLQCDLRLGIGEVELPPERWLKFEPANLGQTPEAEGVILLCGDDRKPTLIKGTENIRAALEAKLTESNDAVFFQWEEDGMYTKRESELIQQHLEQYGKLPGGGDDELDDLF
jgi:NADPH-dependent glutamate synthase beta subunit-like oxidoreductase